MTIALPANGFDPAIIGATHEQRRHLGLPAKIERVEWAGGELYLRSRPGAGTTVELILPAQAVVAAERAPLKQAAGLGLNRP